LQPLVENAVKHGISRTEEAAGVEVTVVSSGGKITMVVENEGPAPPAEWRPGAVGIRNLQSRCQLLFGSNFGFSMFRTAGGKTRTELEIPVDSRRV
jgi:LytS/YehU family sensor histidine kinase